MPTVGSGRYSPGPGMVSLLRGRSYQEIRSSVAKCSLSPPGFLAIDSENRGFLLHQRHLRHGFLLGLISFDVDIRCLELTGSATSHYYFSYYFGYYRGEG